MDTIKDVINSFLGAIFLLISIVAIPEIRRKKIYLITAVAMVILLFYFGADKIYRDKKKDEAINISDSAKIRKIDTLSISLHALTDTLSAIRRKDLRFQQKLESEFAIKRDSNNNPIKTKTYNTNFRDAGVVNIGND